MHSNRDAKRIVRRRGGLAVVVAGGDPEIHPAYTPVPRKRLARDSTSEELDPNCPPEVIHAQKLLYERFCC
jgi:hypothetical protein